MAMTANDELTAGEIKILVDGLSDDVAFSWALIHLGIGTNLPAQDLPPSADQITEAFSSFERLVLGAFAKLGRIERVDGEPPGEMSPVRHVEEPIHDVRERVDRVCHQAADWGDWAFCCWLVNTEKGDAVTRRAIAIAANEEQET